MGLGCEHATVLYLPGYVLTVCIVCLYSVLYRILHSDCYCSIVLFIVLFCSRVLSLAGDVAVEGSS